MISLLYTISSWATFRKPYDSCHTVMSLVGKTNIPTSNSILYLSLIPRPLGEEKRPGINCLSMETDSQVFLGMIMHAQAVHTRPLLSSHMA